MEAPGPRRWAALLALWATALWGAEGQGSREGEPCVMPYGQPGTCSNIYKCPELLALLQKTSLTPDEADYLNRARCGFASSLPLVCCVSNTNPPPRPVTSPPRPGGGWNGGGDSSGGGSGGWNGGNGGGGSWNGGGGSDGGFNAGGSGGRPGSSGGGRPGSSGGGRPGSSGGSGGGGRPGSSGGSGGGGRPGSSGGSGGGGGRPGSSGGGIPGSSGEGSVVGEAFPPTDVSNHPNLRMLPQDRCGPSAADRIIGGTVADLYAYPWMALLGYRSMSQTSRPVTYRCGGSLVSERYVLTAAHCVESRRGSWRLASVRLGEHTLENDVDCKPLTNSCLPPPVEVGVEQTIVYPFYDTATKHHDVALVRLARRLDFRREEFVRPVCLPVGAENQNRGLDGTSLVVAGWGATETGEGSKTLLDVNVPTVPLQKCGDVYKKITKKDIIIPQQICAGGVKGMDSCTGDSGGPLMHEAFVDGEVKTVQFGVVSFGYQCALQGVPGVYTRVAYYMQWILDTMRP